MMWLYCMRVAVNEKLRNGLYSWGHLKDLWHNQDNIASEVINSKWISRLSWLHTDFCLPRKVWFCVCSLHFALLPKYHVASLIQSWKFCSWCCIQRNSFLGKIMRLTKWDICPFVPSPLYLPRAPHSVICLHLPSLVGTKPWSLCPNLPLHLHRDFPVPHFVSTD